MDHPDLTPRAGQILRALGLPHSSLEPVESWSSAVWMTREYVVHYHVIGPPGRLEHEARVAARLAPEVRYPTVIAVGRDGEHDWLVTRRVPGVALTEAWPWLTPAERRSAVHLVAAQLRAVHASPAQDLVPPCLQLGVPALSRLALVDRLRSLPISPAFERLLVAADTPWVMAHGDFHFNQVLWHEGHVTALLDLEMSHAEAPDWDLGTFLESCYDPVRVVPRHLEAATKREDYCDAPVWLREAYPEMFAYASLRDRLALQALVFRFPELMADPGRSEEILQASIEQARRLERLLS